MSDSEPNPETGHVPARLSKQDAVAILNRRGVRFLRPLVPGCFPSKIAASSVRLVWMPQYLIDLRIESARGEAVQQVTLDTYCGVFALWNIRVPPAAGRPDGECFPPRIDVSTGIRQAVEALTRTTLHMRGQKGKPHVTGHDRVQLLYYPYWVACFERRPGRYDIRIVDGVMGERPGNQIKRAILEAFIDASQ